MVWTPTGMKQKFASFKRLRPAFEAGFHCVQDMYGQQRFPVAETAHALSASGFVQAQTASCVRRRTSSVSIMLRAAVRSEPRTVRSQHTGRRARPGSAPSRLAGADDVPGRTRRRSAAHIVMNVPTLDWRDASPERVSLCGAQRR